MKTPEAMSEYLNLVIKGARLYFKDGHHNPPPSVSDARDEYRKVIDSLGMFISEQCMEVDSDTKKDFVKTSDFHNEYNHWRQKNAMVKESSRKIKTQMEKKGYPQVKSSLWYYEGIKMTPGDEIFI